MEAFELSKKSGYDYTLRSESAPYYVMFLLVWELSAKLEQGKLEEARAAVKAFIELLRSKLAAGHRASQILATSIWLTEVSGAGGHHPKTDFMTREAVERLNLTASDLQPVWELVSSVPTSEWDAREVGQRHLAELISQATGTYVYGSWARGEIPERR